MLLVDGTGFAYLILAIIVLLAIVCPLVFLWIGLTAETYEQEVLGGLGILSAVFLMAMLTEGVLAFFGKGFSRALLDSLNSRGSTWTGSFGDWVLLFEFIGIIAASVYSVARLLRRA